MTLDEARALLGVDAEVTPRELRRAYLRGVKGSPPERDPEGFARIREAFELLERVAEGVVFSEALAERLRSAAQEATPEPPPPRAPAPSSAEAERLRSEGRPLEAAELTHEFLAEGRDGGRLNPEDLDVALELLLDLHRALLLSEARRLQAELEAAVAALGVELAWMQDGRAVRWALARDLGALPDDFPSVLRSTLARGAQLGDWTAVGIELRRLELQDGRAALLVGRLLSERAPQLSAPIQAMLDAMERRQREEAEQTASGGAFMWVRLLVPLVLVILLVGQTTSLPRCPRHSRVPPQSSTALVPSIPASVIIPSEWLGELADEHYRACQVDEPRLDPKACDQAQVALDLIVYAECHAARYEVVTLQQWGHRNDPLVVKLVETLELRCGALRE